MPSKSKQLTTYVGSSPSSYQTFYGKQRVHLCKEESKAGVTMAFECFPQKHSSGCKWRLDVLQPEVDAPDAIYVETGHHHHQLDPTDYNIAVAKKEAYVCVQEDTITPVDQILLDLCKKNRLTRSSLRDFDATCGHLERRRQEHLIAGHFIPEPSMPWVPPQRLEAAAPQPDKLLEIETAPPTSPTEATENATGVGTAENRPAVEMDTSEMCQGMCISDITTGAQLIDGQDGRGEAQPEITNEGSIPIDRNVTEEQYRKASVELATASEMRQAAHDLREENKQAQEEAAWLQSCREVDHQLAQEQLLSATETGRHFKEMRTTAEDLQQILTQLLGKAEEDRRHATTLRCCAINTHQHLKQVLEEAQEERRQAAELLSTARKTLPHEQQLLKEAEEKQQKARQLMAECTALKQQTVTEMKQAEHQALVVEQGHVNNDAMEISDNNDLVNLGPPGHIRRNPAPRPAQIVDLEFEEIERQVYRNEMELAMVPDAGGVLWPFIAEYVPEDIHFNAVIPDPALTAPHGTRSRGPTICLNCDEHIATCVMVPCGHMVVCGPCGATLQTTTRTCPACKKGDTDNAVAIRVYSL